MEYYNENKYMALGMLAHVDAGKTTLSEGFLYLSGCIDKMGRVDHKDAFFDTNEMERKRGITIFSKQAQISIGEFKATLLDTPGHTDFSAEMERTLSVIDYGILIISGSEGIQGHTETLWKLLEQYKIPVFIFVNKMDQVTADKEAVFSQILERLSGDVVIFSKEGGNTSDRGFSEAFYEAVATCSEDALEEYLETGQVSDEKIRKMIWERKLFPCYFGSALKMEGVEEFYEGLGKYLLKNREFEKLFGARVYQIRRDAQGNRVTFFKVTNGCIRVRDNIPEKGKINQLRIYSGDKFQTVERVEAGMICGATGLSNVRAGEGLGSEAGTEVVPILEPVLKYRILWPEGVDPLNMLPKLRLLEEEAPELHIEWQEEKKETLAMLMGEIQTDILKQRIRDEFGVEAEFGQGQIIYKESIAGPVPGFGHFEPLRHYAEVHLLLEPLPRGSGMEFACDVSEDVLDRNWQRLVLTHLMEKEHKGVLTGGALTDMRITLIAGRAHLKHTEGGDFRQATYRAVRQGLMSAESVLLEPYYDFVLEIPPENLGRAMTDLEQRMAEYEILQEESRGGTLKGYEKNNSETNVVITGHAPVSLMGDYPTQVLSYTKGFGRISLTPGAYGPCHNALGVIGEIGYNPQEDAGNPSSSVFCAHGSGYLVSYEDVPKAVHIKTDWRGYLSARNKRDGIVGENAGSSEPSEIPRKEKGDDEIFLGTEEVDAILKRAGSANKKPEGRNPYRKTKISERSYGENKDGKVTLNFAQKKEKYLLVDGYNIIFAWDELAKTAKDNMDGARNRLMDILCNYQGYKKCNVILVFDAYRVQGHITEILDYNNIHVVFTKEAETADQYIEKFAHEHGRKYDVTVATSDGLEQVIIRGEGCRLMSASEFLEEVEDVERRIREYLHS